MCITETTPSRGQGVVLSIRSNKEFSFTNMAAIALLDKALNEPFFTELRSNQKTAYIVQNSSGNRERELFHFFYLQSDTHTGKDLLHRIEVFLEDFLLHFDTMLPELRFEENQTCYDSGTKDAPSQLARKRRKFTFSCLRSIERFFMGRKENGSLRKTLLQRGCRDLRILFILTKS